MKKYLFLMCFALFLFSCNHDNGNGKTERQTLPPPSGVKAVATENVGELKVTWKQVTNNSGYEVYYKNTKSNEKKSQAIAKDDVLVTLTGLEGGTEYEVSLKTKGDGKSFLDSPASYMVKATPKNAGGGGGPQKLAIPASFSASGTGKEGEVELRWEAVQHAQGYVISYKKADSTDNKATQEVENDKISSLISTLEDNVEYSFSIMAKGDGSTWLDSDESVEVKATPSGKLKAPENLKVFALNNKGGALFASWDTVENNNGYTIKYQAEGESERTQEVEKDAIYSELEGLTEEKEYTVFVMTKAISLPASSDYSEGVKCKTLASSDALILEKITIETQEDIKAESFINISVKDDGSLYLDNPKNLIFKPTTDEKTITPHFTSSNLKSYEIYEGLGTYKKKLENNKIKFELDKRYFFEIVAKTNKDLVVSYIFRLKALDCSFDVVALYLKGNYDTSSNPNNELLERITNSTDFQIKPKLRNSKDLKLNVKKDDNLGENQRFLFMLYLDNDDDMEKIEFDAVIAENEEVQGKKCYFKVLTPDSTGKAVVNAKFTLKSGAVEDRKYEFSKSELSTNTDIKAILFGSDEIIPVAMPSSKLTVFVPKGYNKKTYPIRLKVADNATYNLYLWEESIHDWKKVPEGSNLKLDNQEENEILVDVVPEIGDGLYAWDEVSIRIIIGVEDAPNSPKDILIGQTSVKNATTKDSAVAIDLKDTEAITIKLTNSEDDEFDEDIILCTVAEYNKFVALSQKERINGSIEAPSKDDFSTTEGREFVLILKYDVTEKFKDAIYHVWLKKKE